MDEKTNRDKSDSINKSMDRIERLSYQKAMTDIFNILASAKKANLTDYQVLSMICDKITSELNKKI